MYTYKIVESNDKDALATKVSKTGLVAEFVLQDVYNHKLKVEQDIKEKEAKINISKATMKNIEENHKDVAEIIKSIKKNKRKAEGIFGTLYLWIKEDMERDTNQRMVDERKALIEEYDAELETIHSELNISRPVKVAYTKANK